MATTFLSSAPPLNNFRMNEMYSSFQSDFFQKGSVPFSVQLKNKNRNFKPCLLRTSAALGPSASAKPVVLHGSYLSQQINYGISSDNDSVRGRGNPFKVKSRRATAEAKPPKPDPVYRNRLVNMLVNRTMKHGKKSLSYKIIYRAVKRIQQKTEANPLSVLRQAIRGVTPGIAVKSRRVGGATQQVPTEVGSSQGKALAIRWLLAAARKRPGRDMSSKLSFELMDAAKGTGDAIRKREETHKMAEANRAFAHFR